MKFLEDAVDRKCSDDSVKNQRLSLTLLLKFLVLLLEQNLFTIVWRRAVAATLVMLNIPNKPKKFWKIGYEVKYIQVDDLRKAISAIIQSVGIDKTYSVSCVSAAAITKLLKHNIRCAQIYRFTHHSHTASMVRQYYDKNNNVESRKVHSQTEEKLDSEEVEEQEGTLLEELNMRESQCRLENINPRWSPTKGEYHVQAQQTVAEEEKALFQDQFNIERVNKQSKSSLSLQEVVYNSEEYKQSSGRDMSSSFVPPHQDVSTLGNLEQMESYEVQMISSADREHEAPIQQEKKTDDS
ncbi:MAG: hypothetical protein EZS28_035029 [Streblomastix strix]|uniref:Tyr recombinase domain-containing protein n=1 Tax=Streblomastix strix TaxID=222440 RepID=A0A5J4UGZ6_9EUKA|nr:MAG: hypothetical protein EZS28_035029 [Streblomastix strix]